MNLPRYRTRQVQTEEGHLERKEGLDVWLPRIIGLLTIAAAVWKIPAWVQQVTDLQNATRAQVADVQTKQLNMGEKFVSKDEYEKHNHSGRVPREGR